jgi:tRNA dimethylallyltransferase
VRRQRSWFRRDPRIVWLDGGAPAVLDQALDQALSRAMREARPGARA